MDSSQAQVTAVMFDTVDLDAAVRFWTWLLDLEIVYRTDVYVYLAQMTEGGPHLAFQQVPEPRPGKNRLHFDVQVDDRAATAQAILEAGGAFVGEVTEPGFPTWSVMTDPLGNEFCIYEAPSE